ncbi:general secretion pathway protein E/type IV pilus assembly protein PilB [Roseimicrobium gellanilyticum]|uniref:General secretion pathway protein E/type IV pilus assembly protein PilB n=1 Tax=Roseimicrobium gellanilyticum TaxID=748857 RepID=A0A366H4W5_9BACT|nr:ATPase, T2SS/T4P/T4SS family [Roseimicrobium gellanilyticum]RBP36381.1 general secretion pathway protein E/type IV pilus assembly protein PilB [Roseimicrobium gellanilyticum]
MNLNLGIEFNETIQALVLEELRKVSPSDMTLSDEALIRKSSKARILGAVGKASGLAAFPHVKELVDSELVSYCDPAALSRGLFVPLRRSAEQILLAVANPWDYRADDYCSVRFPDEEILKVVTLPAEISSVIEGSSSSAGPSRADLEALEVDEFSLDVPDFDVTRQYDEPIAQLVASMVSDAIKQHASDIHIKTEKTSIAYSFRVDGDIGPKIDMPVKLKDRIDAFLLNLMRLPPEDRSKRPGISGRFTASYYGRSVGVRYERHRTYRGYHVTMRLLDKTHLEARLGMGTLAFDEGTLFELEKAMAVPSGIIVMSGPTGSGKSTTLNAMLRELNRPEDNILTLENPVEDEIPGVTHCDLRDSSEFKPMITSFMRSDPDIILMGEVRDRESAELAIEAAITGHKVLTTIHTPRASQIIERFEQLGMERWKIAQTLKAACAQRLVKLLCPSCRIKMDGVPEKDRRLFHMEDFWATQPVFEHSKEGCQECKGRGYSGRTAILEILPISPKVGDKLAKGEITPYELEHEIRREYGLPSLRDNGFKLLQAGRTDLAALRKVLDLTYDC